MIRRALFLLAAAAIYVMVKRNMQATPQRTVDRIADAQWANEGGANSPTSI